MSFGTGRSAHAFVLSPLVPVVGVLCSAQSHAIPAASRFFILAPSGPCERQLRCIFLYFWQLKNIFGKQIGNVFVFPICFDVGLAVLCIQYVLKMTTNLQITYEPI